MPVTCTANTGLFTRFEQSWFSAAETVCEQGGRYMIVYRSVLVEDTDVMFTDVADMLRAATLVVSDTVDDDNMMFGRAVWQLWEL